MNILKFIESIVCWKKHIACIVKNENYHSARKLENIIKMKIKKEQSEQTKLGNYYYRKNELTDITLHSKDPGVTKDAICNEEVIVSLTTYSSRFYEAYLAIESIMQGTLKPNRIILWLGEELRDEPIPDTLQKQMKRGLEIRYVRDILSYKKLMFALKEFPEATIITIDDDVIYEYDFIENLIVSHIKKPGCICSYIISIVPDDLKENFIERQKWIHPIEYMKEYDRWNIHGCAGVLYPPNSLANEVFNEEVFMNICKYADDVWFSAMAMLNGTKAVYCYPHLGIYIPLLNYDVQSIGLTRINDHGDVLNHSQIKDVFSKYKLCGF